MRKALFAIRSSKQQLKHLRLIRVLSARSSVFKSMFTPDMREKTTDCVIIEDLEADTVRWMLVCLYSDNLDDLDWKVHKVCTSLSISTT
ncbi:hypothetical protein AVEN_211335-1 [Araneus ventricosus]|uniref:BTB domain-containing protein n=1 Tax=Araneus ventricosus TaxID=182803 RepID=A0A4Y2M4M4_ARAVE|nr:hypothetical protein AVEN_211335-1 [Araneus ventricosus]